MYRKGTPEYEAWKNTPAYEEYRRKLSESHKGQVSPTKGTKHTPEARAKMSAWHKTNEQTEEGKERRRKITEKTQEYWSDPENRQKASETQKGRPGHPHTEETKAHLSQINMGISRPHTPEAKAKISEALKEQHAAGTRPIVFGGSEGIAEFNRTRKQMLGKHHSDETKENMSLAQKGKKLTEEHRKSLSKPSLKKSEARRAYFASLSPEEQAARMEKLFQSGKTKDTSLEIYVASLLDRWDICYTPQARIGRYYADFLIPDQLLVVECAGCWWHGCEQCGYNDIEHADKIVYDKKRVDFLISKGYTVITLWEHELYPLIKAERGNLGTV